MLNKLGLSFAFVLLSTGTILLYDAVSRSDATQTARVIGGAASFSLGLVTISLVAKDWWNSMKWTKYYKSAD